jgi:regulator of replication initiation timing
MGYGSAGTPPWVDEERIDRDREKRKLVEALTDNETLKLENEKLKKRIRLLEEEIKELKK